MALVHPIHRHMDGGSSQLTISGALDAQLCHQFAVACGHPFAANGGHYPVAGDSLHLGEGAGIQFLAPGFFQGKGDGVVGIALH